MERGQFFTKVRVRQKQLIEALRRVPANRQIQAGLRGLTSEREAAAFAEVYAHNRAAVAVSRAKDFGEVVLDFVPSCTNFSNSLERAPAEDLLQVYADNETASKPLWQSIAVNTNEHLDEPLQDLENWKIPG